MYLPYLRGGQYDLLALRELLDKKILSDNIIPIIEPIKVMPTLTTTLQSFAKSNNEIGVVLNPNVGKFINDLKEQKRLNTKFYIELVEIFKDPKVIKSYIIDDGYIPKSIDQTNIHDSIVIIKTRDGLNELKQICKTGQPYLGLIPKHEDFENINLERRVVLTDSFNKKQRNSDYADNTDEFFSSEHKQVQRGKHIGCSDYSIIGKDYIDGGFSPYAVAIHIVYFDNESNLRIHHFVSDSNFDTKNPAGKFGEAASKMAKWVQSQNIQKTEGIKQLLNYYNKGRYPGLPSIKKYSIMHHIELLDTYFKSSNTIH